MSLGFGVGSSSRGSWKSIAKKKREMRREKKVKIK